MKRNTAIAAILALFACSAVIYGIQFVLFHDSRDTLFYMLQDWAFLPIQIAVVTIVAGKVVDDHEKEARLDKTRMLASSFFSDPGTEFLEKTLGYAVNASAIVPIFRVDDTWTARNFSEARDKVRALSLDMCLKPEDYVALRSFLREKRLAVQILVSNPLLLEHESFTDMLWAIFHLSDELEARKSFETLPESDIEHLNKDMEYAVRETLANWICHMENVKDTYPYLFMLETGREPILARKLMNE